MLVFATAPVMAQRTIEAILVLDGSDLAEVAADVEFLAKSHLIISKVATPQTRTTDTDNGLLALPSNAIHRIWAGMPDLEALFE
ncbi:hypothetical protein C6499_19835 [Candidatus Poribacteria bacterium]|nr:MAG: hypothetical protein C6499_19835 [Candidatus Poribacteria bacterium]